MIFPENLLSNPSELGTVNGRVLFVGGFFYRRNSFSPFLSLPHQSHRAPRKPFISCFLLVYYGLTNSPPLSPFVFLSFFRVTFLLRYLAHLTACRSATTFSGPVEKGGVRRWSEADHAILHARNFILVRPRTVSAMYSILLYIRDFKWKRMAWVETDVRSDQVLFFPRLLPHFVHGERRLER